MVKNRGVLMISFKHKGDFTKTTNFLKRTNKLDMFSLLNKYGQEGVSALSANTPVESGLTANSWDYRVVKNAGSYSLQWFNNNIEKGVKIAVILQYGHATRNGGWVEGIDYINPSLAPVFNKIADDAWKEVTK